MDVYRSGLDHPLLDDAFWGMCFQTPHELEGQISGMYTYADRAISIAQADGATPGDIFNDVMILYPTVELPSDIPSIPSGSDGFLDPWYAAEIAQLVTMTVPNLLKIGNPLVNLQTLRKLANEYLVT